MQCDRCEEWFHLLCVGLAEEEVSEEEEYECYNCKHGRPPQAVGAVASPAKRTNMYSISYSGGIVKTDTDLDSVLMCHDESVREVSRIPMYHASMDSFDSAGNSGAVTSMSKVTQLSFESTDESSQDELKSSFTLASGDGRNVITAPIPQTISRTEDMMADVGS